MTFMNCEKKGGCIGVSVLISFILGVVALLLQISGTIAFSDINTIALLLIAAFYLAVTLMASAAARFRLTCNGILTALLVGIGGTVGVSAVILLRQAAFSAYLYGIAVGILVAFAVLMFASMICLIQQLTRLGE